MPSDELPEGQIHIEEVQIDPKLPREVQDTIVQGEIDNAKQGRMLGLLLVLVGVALVIAGVAGAIDLHITSGPVTGSVANASPGIVVMLIGFGVIWRTNLKIDKAK